MKSPPTASGQFYDSAAQQIAKLGTATVRCTLCGQLNRIRRSWRGIPAHCGRCGSILFLAPRVILLDKSGSMNEMDGHRRRIDHLTAALSHILPQVPGAKLIAFSTTAEEIGSLKSIGEPDGETALHLGLRAAAMRSPSHVILFSDGECDSEGEALESMHYLKCRVDTVYCGPEDNAEAIAFLNRLARIGRGTATVHSFRSQTEAFLLPKLKQLLCLPPS
jgi:hypothetical protein